MMRSIKLMLLFLLLSSTASANLCYIALNGKPLAIENQRGVHAIYTELTGIVPVTTAFSDPNLKVIEVDSVFSEADQREAVVLGFGAPNVYLGLPNNDGPNKGKYSKVAAKSVKRADTKIVDPKGKFQAGVYIKIPGLTSEQITRLKEVAENHEGTRQWTCVNANCRILQDSGFTSGNRALEKFYFPKQLLVNILNNGISLDGVPLEYEVIKVGEGSLEGLISDIDRSVRLTPLRHLNRSLHTKARNSSGPKKYWYIATSKTTNNLLILIQKVLRKPPKDDVLTFNADTALSGDNTLQVANPSQLGRVAQGIWGQHRTYELLHSGININRFLPNILKPYPDKNPDFMTRLKKKVLFNKNVVGALRSHISEDYSVFKGLSPKNIFDLIKTDSNKESNIYNIVMTGDKITVGRNLVRYKAVDWVLSKHVLLANYSPDIRFAGEIFKNEKGQFVLTNDSGTFQPSNEQLAAAIAMLTEMFPGYEFIAQEAY